MRVSLIEVPYDSGLAGLRMGAGPGHLLAHGMRSSLQAQGHEVETTTVRAISEPPTEVVTMFELDALVAAVVRDSARRDKLPVILSGNCSNASHGAIAGGSPEELGILWLDGHLDFDTPETTREGSIDAMALAIATGQCWRRMAGAIEGFAPVPAADVVHVGTRASAVAIERLRDAGAAVITAGSMRAVRPEVPGDLSAALDGLASRVRDLYLHLDLDVLDPVELAPANEFVIPAGLSVEDVRRVIDLLDGRFTIKAVGITCYDPSGDPEGRVAQAAVTLASAVLAQ
jgi:arginase